MKRNDFDSKSSLITKLFFTNLRIFNIIQNETDLDLTLYLIKSNKISADEPDLDSILSSKLNLNYNNTFAGNNEFFDAFYGDDILLEITPSIMKKILYLSSLNFSISFKSIYVSITDASNENNNNSVQNSDSKAEESVLYSIQNFLRIFSLGGNNSEYLFGQNSEKKEKTIHFYLESLENFENCFSLFDKALDFQKFSSNINK